MHAHAAYLFILSDTAAVMNRVQVACGGGAI